MPRGPREKSSTGIYHVMLRGINKQTILEDDEDYEKLLQILKECKTVSEFELYSYCLMGNHVHLLLKEGKESLAQILSVSAQDTYFGTIGSICNADIFFKIATKAK